MAQPTAFSQALGTCADTIFIPKGNDTIGYGLKIFDRFGDRYDLKHVQLNNTQRVYETTTLCGFTLALVSNQQDTFWDSTNVMLIANVFLDLFYLLECPSVIPACATEDTLFIFLQSYNNPNSLTLATASSFYYNIDNQAGLSTSSVWRFLNGGVQPFKFPYINGSSLFHGTINVNAAKNWNYTNTPENDKFDFYNTILHEIFHLLGFSSQISANGQPIFNNYNFYDTHLQINNTPLINHIPNSCQDYEFNNTYLNNLTSTDCPNIVLNGAFSSNIPVFTVNLPGVWQPGTSLSHLDATCYNNPLTPKFLMSPTISAGDPDPMRRPTQEEANILCDIGYKTTAYFGGNDAIHNFYTPCDGQLAANDDNCFEVGSITKCEVLNVSYADLMQNDINVTNIDFNCLNVVIGNGTLNPTANGFTYTPGATGINVISYIGNNSSQKYSNTAMFYFYVKICEQQLLSCPTQNCNLICNPNLYDQDCNEQYGVFFEDPNPNNLPCTNFNGWTDAFPSCDYTTTENTPVSPGAIAIVVDKSHKVEVLTAGINLLPNKNYILSIVRKSANSLSIGANTFTYLGLSQLNVVAGNTNSFVPYIPPGIGINQNLLPFNPADQILLSDDNFVPNDFNWKQIATCFTVNQASNFNAIYLYPKEQTTGFFPGSGGWGCALIDQFDVIEDIFIENDTATITCKDTITIGQPLCLELTNLHYKWQASTDNGNTWMPLPNFNDITQITVSPNITTMYKITRFLETNGLTYSVIGAECIEKQATITVIVNPNKYYAYCCSINQTYNQTTPFTALDNLDNLNDGQVSWSINNNPWGAGQGTPNNPVRINADLIVPSGIKLILNKMSFQFGPVGRVLVQKNAQLIIDNSRLNGDTICQTMWQGIRVVGPGKNALRKQILGVKNFGTLDVSKKAIIENAIIGVAAMDMPIIDLDTLDLNLINIPSSNTLSLSSYLLNKYTTSATALNSAGGLCLVGVFAGATNLVSFNNCFQGVNFSWHSNNQALIPGQTNPFSSAVKNTQFNCNAFLWYPFTHYPNANGIISEAGIVNNFHYNAAYKFNTFTNQS